MRHFHNIVLVTIFVLTYNHAKSEDAEDQKFLKLRDKAADCEVGSRIKSDRCNWCSCEAKGVMLCSRVLCLPIDPDDDTDLEDIKEDEHLDNDLDLDMAPEPNTDVGEGNDEVDTLKKLRRIAIRCKEGEKVQRGCILCMCVLSGVMSCKRLLGCEEPLPPKG